MKLKQTNKLTIHILFVYTFVNSKKIKYKPTYILFLIRKIPKGILYTNTHSERMRRFLHGEWNTKDDKVQKTTKNQQLFNASSMLLQQLDKEGRT